MTRRRLALALLLMLLPLVLFLAWKPPLLDDVSFSRAVFDRHGRLLRLTLAADQSYRLFTPLKEISPQLRDSVLLYEDRHFYAHAGVNPVALMRAFFTTYIAGGRRMGASTLTMQLVRIKDGMNTRSLPGKIWQIARAIQMEAHYSKDALFEAYLNLAPYGYNINGAGAASFIYFHARPQDLTLPEAMTLAVVPQSPAQRSPDPADPAKSTLVSARNRLFALWLAAHPADADQKAFFSLPLPVHGIKDLPFEAPHVTQDLLAASKDGRINTTIDLDLQQLLQGVLSRYVRDHRNAGLQNASLLLVNTRSMEVESLVGSADFFNAAIDGQVDGTRARRSPGSTLKPFIYALAMDQGLIHPASILGDAPVSFGSYAPDNFERDFRGPVSARNALRLSRNIPAIRLASELHAPDLYDFLKNAGIGGLRDKAAYGLSIALGGAEVTQRELATLYAALANDGIEKPLVFRRDAAVAAAASRRLISPESSFMTLDMLADTPRPFGTESPLHVYWKTGTSNGFHDAWTAGVFGHYVLVVWVGNFDGRSNPAFIGVQAAAPLFFAIVDAVNGRTPQRESIALKPSGLNLRKVDICVPTGDLSLADCPVRGATWFIPGVSPIAHSDVYRRILVDAASGRRACHEGAGTISRVFEVWPSDLRQTLQKAGIDKEVLPPYQEGCTPGASALSDEGQKPVILSPQPRVQYHAHIDDSAEAITFTAAADGDVQAVSWFVDNLYIGKASPGAPLFWQPQPGVHQVRVIDDHGRSEGMSLEVSVLQ